MMRKHYFCMILGNLSVIVIVMTCERNCDGWVAQRDASREFFWMTTSREVYWAFLTTVRTLLITLDPLAWQSWMANSIDAWIDSVEAFSFRELHKRASWRRHRFITGRKSLMGKENMRMWFNRLRCGAAGKDSPRTLNLSWEKFFFSENNFSHFNSQQSQSISSHERFHQRMFTQFDLFRVQQRINKWKGKIEESLLRLVA